MNRVIAVRPEPEAWSLRIDQQEGVLLFSSGAEAEGVARRLAHRLAGAGERVDVLIHLRDGSLAGRLRFTPRGRSPPREILPPAPSPAGPCGRGSPSGRGRFLPYDGNLCDARASDVDQVLIRVPDSALLSIGMGAQELVQYK